MQFSKQSPWIGRSLVIALLTLFTLFIRTPLIVAGLPYLYREDEGHHFNRTMDMAKSGDLDPHYFHKPSLHFYLRLPVIYATTKYLKWQNKLNSLKEVRTHDTFGLADFSYTASHPIFVETNRLWSILWSIGLVICTYLIARTLAIPLILSIFAAILTSLSPEAVINSPIIGVDMLMSLMCALCALFALRLVKNGSLKNLISSSIFAGLAISSKYNALPIAILPVTSLLFRKELTTKNFLIASLLPVISFFIASPYILISIKLFIEQLTYEIWHYGVAGHIGNEAQPGIPQAIFYLKWLCNDGLGIIAATFALLGLIFLIINRNREFIVFLSFPVLYTLMMIFQKANFPRNMVVVIPFASICAAYLVELIRKNRSALFCCTIMVLSLVQPSLRTAQIINEETTQPESRKDLADYLLSQKDQHHEIAISRELMVNPELYKLKGVDAFIPEKASLSQLIQDGYDKFILPGWASIDDSLVQILEKERSFNGDPLKERIVKNPVINIFSLKKEAAQLLPLIENVPSIFFDANLKPKGCQQGGEDYCWLTKRVTKLVFERDLNEKGIKVMSPWEDQELTVLSYDGSDLMLNLKLKAGEWREVRFKAGSALSVFAIVNRISSPASQKVSGDERRLGVAIGN